MGNENKTVKRQRRKILRLTKEIENFDTRFKVMQARMEKADKEIVILQEDLADAARTITELSPKDELNEVSSER